MDIEVIIPVRDRVRLLERTLQSLARQHDMDFIVTVVDDGSTDDIRRACEQLSPSLSVRYRRRTEAPSPSRARDDGARLSASDVLVFLDAGIVVCEEFVDAHRAYHRTNYGKVGVGYYHGHLPHADQEDTVVSVSSAAGELELPERQTGLQRQDLRASLPPLETLAQPWMYAWGGNLSCRRGDYLSSGGFSREHDYGFEDLDLAYRLYDNGCGFGFVDGGWGFHIPHPSPPLQRRQELDRHGWARSYVRDRSFELEVARLAIDLVGTGSEALSCLDDMTRAITWLLTAPVTWPHSALAPHMEGIELPRPLLAIGGSEKDLDAFDYVTLARPGYRTSARTWGCAGVLLPDDVELRSAVLWLHWVERLAQNTDIGGALLQTFTRELARRTSTVLVVDDDQVASPAAVTHFIQACERENLRLLYSSSNNERRGDVHRIQ